ncbi:MAG: high-potential iron-sulfur protein [Vulcanimicrobiaceae bacterium]
MKEHAGKLDRPEFLRKVAGLPVAAVALGLAAQPAEAADNKAQFKYQDKPGAGGKHCSQCKFFKAPSSCSIVTGKISPNGYCIAWAKK